MPQIVSQSNDPEHDALLGRIGLCVHARTGEYQDRCGYGPRLPFLVISPYAKVNFVDHRLTDQTSIIKFIEDNWGLGRIGNQSFYAKAGSLMNMFDFTTSQLIKCDTRQLFSCNNFCVYAILKIRIKPFVWL